MFNFSSPYDLQWDGRDSRISDALGRTSFTVKDIEHWKGMKRVIKSVQVVLQYIQSNGYPYPRVLKDLSSWLSDQKQVCSESLHITVADTLTESWRLFHSFNITLIRAHLKVKRTYDQNKYLRAPCEDTSLQSRK